MHKREWYSPRGRPKQEENIQMDLKETASEDMDWTNLAQDTDSWWAVANMAMNLQVTQNVRDFLTG